MNVTVGLTSIVLAAMIAAAPAAAMAEEKYPSKPVRMIVPFTPGAASGMLGRIVSQSARCVNGAAP